MDHRFITTAFELPGYKVAGTLGVVRGIVVRSRSAIGNLGASIQSIFGGNITILTDLCERARMDAYNQMADHATALGANGIIGVRYDATELMPGITEVLCYGPPSSSRARLKLASGYYFPSTARPQSERVRAFRLVPLHINWQRRSLPSAESLMPISRRNWRPASGLKPSSLNGMAASMV